MVGADDLHDDGPLVGAGPEPGDGVRVEWLGLVCGGGRRVGQHSLQLGNREVAEFDVAPRAVTYRCVVRGEIADPAVPRQRVLVLSIGAQGASDQPRDVQVDLTVVAAHGAGEVEVMRVVVRVLQLGRAGDLEADGPFPFPLGFQFEQAVQAAFHECFA